MEKFQTFRRGKMVLFFTSFLALMALVFVACRQDQDIIGFSGSNSTVKTSARQYYDNALVELKQKNIESVKTDAHFTALDFTPDWNTAILHNQNGKNYVEVPIKFAKGSILAASGSSLPTKFDTQSDILMPARLIITQSRDGSFDANIMVIQSETPYSNGFVPEFDLFKKINNFTGLEYNYHLDGSFNKGWKHRDGQLVGSFVLSKNDLRNRSIGLRSCTDWYLIDLNTGEIVAYLGRSCDTPPVVLDGGTSLVGWGSGSTGCTTGNCDPNPCPPPCAATSADANNFTTLDFGYIDIDDTRYFMGSMIFSLYINVTNCPRQEWNIGDLSYSTDTNIMGTYVINSKTLSRGPRTEPTNPACSQCGFKTTVLCKVNATYSAFGGPWGGIPINGDVNESVAFFVH